MIVPKHYENLGVLHENTMPYRAYYMPASKEMGPLVHDREKSDRIQLLNDTWNFKFYKSIYDLQEKFFEEGASIDGFANIPVPGIWQNFGYDSHQYTNVRYPIPLDPPYVPQENPCGTYIYDFEYYKDADAPKAFLNFEGVDSCFYVWMNGAYVGYSQVSHATSEFDVVGYNEDWVAIWSEGGVDESRGTIRQCGEKDGTAFTSWKPAVYFVPRKNCYILDINNQVTTPPEIEAIGKATAPLMVKTTPDSTDYVKSGVYKINQSVQIVDAIPQNGHYKIYYKHGLYYVESQYVNVQYTNTQKPAISYKAEVSADCDVSDGSSVVGKVKTGTTVDVIEKDYDGTNSKIYFNSKECYIPTSNLTDFVSTPSASGIAALGAPIGVLAVDSPWSAYGAEAYTKEAYELLKAHEYGESYEGAKIYADILNRNEISFLNDQDWANVYNIEDNVKISVDNVIFYKMLNAKDAVYNIEDYSYTPDPDYPDEIETGKAYTILYDGNIRYILQNDEHYQTFTYYPGTEFSKTSVAKTQPVYIDGNKYNAVAYNIDDSNYFKLRDIAEMLNGTIKTFDIKYDASTNSIDMLSYFDYTSVGGELTAGDGETRTAVSSSAFLTLDGVPVQATCYNIDGNNYFKLRDITDVLDCRVDWEEKNQTIWIIPGMTAYDDPNEAVG